MKNERRTTRCFGGAAAMWVMGGLALWGLAGSAAEPPPAGAPGGTLRPIVEAEQEVYKFEPADNGAEPMWCFGNTCIVRAGGKLFASGIRTLPDFKPLNNVRWALFLGAGDGWKPVADGGQTREREPCPLACFNDGRVFLSTNPTLSKPGELDGLAQPQVLQFDAADPAAGFKILTPRWNTDIAFHGHSYRSFAADAERHELVLFYSVGYDKTYWTFCDDHGRWAAQGEIDFPWGAEYEKPQPVRLCYPAVQLKNRAVHFFGVSDIVEPNQAWREEKRRLSGQEWDYEFRRLFYIWSDDITAGKFHKWVEVANREKTCGWLFPCDLRVESDGRVRLLWTERAIDTRLREKFFPGARQSIALNYAVLRNGEVVLRKSIQQWEEGQPGDEPGRGRFHATPDGRLFVIYYASGTNAAGESVTEDRLVQIERDGGISRPVSVPLKQPLSAFFIAGERGGSAPSATLDLLGESAQTMRYARIRLDD